MADTLRRSLAPLANEAWGEIDDVAKRALTPMLSARAVVDFVGPLGMDFGAVNLGRVTTAKRAQGKDLAWGVREVLPLVEVCVPFQLDQAELQNLTRGAKDVDLAPLEQAAQRIATFEEQAVYKGLPEASIEGLLAEAAHKPIPFTTDADQYPLAVGQAKSALRMAGITGPCALVVGTKAFQALNQVTRSGQPLASVLERIVEGQVVWSPALAGAVLLSARGGDFELTVGQDLAIGYAKHDVETVELYFIETFAFRVLEPNAAVELRLKAAK